MTHHSGSLCEYEKLNSTRYRTHRYRSFDTWFFWFLRLFLPSVQGEIVEQATAFHQIGVSSRFADLTGFHDHDPVKILNGIQPVGNGNNGRAASPVRFQ